MWRALAVAAVAGAIGAAGEALEATSENWDEKVLKPVKAGKMAFVKFLAPW